MLKRTNVRLLRRLSTFKDPRTTSLKEAISPPTASHSRVSTTSSSTADYKPFDTKVSRLDNGLRVASEDYFGEYCTFGVAIESGCRHEALYPKGTTHVIEKLAFASTLKHAREDILSAIEKSGALIDCQATRDTIIYATSCHREKLQEMMEIISSTILRPRFDEDEIAEAIANCNFESSELGKQIEIEPFLTDRVHQAAFRSNTLGFRRHVDPSEIENVEDFSRDKLYEYMCRYYTPKRMVLAGVGMAHDELNALALRHLDERSAIWNIDRSVDVSKSPKMELSTAQYTGGDWRQVVDLSEVGIGTPFPHLAHVAVGFEGCGYHDEDFIAFCVMQALLGGGGSFSAGGPGKGMFTRLYDGVLNRCHWLYRCTAFNHSYADTGLFCIQGSAPPERINDALTVILDQFLHLPKGFDAEELDRAKVQLKSQIMMNLEIRPVIFEDMARQVMAQGKRRKPQETMAMIDKVTAEDLIRVSRRMLASKPSLASYGQIENVAKFEQVEEAVAQQDLRLLFTKKKMFGL
ncbi:unnamed protein product, partial [Mesorhabditis spiculigera]